MSIRTVLRDVPGLRPTYHALRAALNAARTARSKFVHVYPAGHFYSPIPSRADVKRRGSQSEPSDAAGDFQVRDAEQLALLQELARYYPELPFHAEKKGDERYQFENGFFSYGDAITLYSMLRHVRPQRVVEVGSGFSSAVMLDVNDRFFDSKIRFTFIEPYPERLRSLLRGDDAAKHQIIVKPVQEVDLSVFSALQPNDILFVDSSHVVKVGSDVARIVFDILPRLEAGVYVHFHDIFWPFEYPDQWLAEGTAWNEAYFLRAFLQYNRNFEIVYFNSYMTSRHRSEVERHLPLSLKNPGGSLWLRKTAK